jgi:hypothetical protein
MSGRASSRRPRAPGVLLGAAAISLVVSGCGVGSTAADGDCPAPRAAPRSETTLLPDGLTFRGIGPITHVVVTEGYVTVRAVSSRPLDQLTVEIQDAVTAAGYRPAGMDNEGFEAEVFFTSGMYAAGQALVRQGACEGRWDIDLVLVDPEFVPSASGTAAPSAPTG